MIWKEPLAVRQQRIKQSRNFQFKHLLKLVFFALFTGPIMIASLLFSHPLHRTDIRSCIFLSVYYSGLLLVVLLVYLCAIILSNLFEATYFLDEKGLRIRRAGFGRILFWRYIINMKIVSHPTLEGVFMIRFVTRVMNKVNVNEIPFESGQIDTAAVFEIYRKYKSLSS